MRGLLAARDIGESQSLLSPRINAALEQTARSCDRSTHLATAQPSLTRRTKITAPVQHACARHEDGGATGDAPQRTGPCKRATSHDGPGPLHPPHRRVSVTHCHFRRWCSNTPCHHLIVLSQLPGLWILVHPSTALLPSRRSCLESAQGRRRTP